MDYLREAGCDVIYHADPPDLTRFGADDVLLVDSLVLEDLAPRLLAVRAELVLLLHVLPSFQAYGARRQSLIRQLLQRSRVFVTGKLTARSLSRLAAGIERDVFLIEPGICDDWQQKDGYAETAHSLLGVANYVPGKGTRRTLKTLSQLRDLHWHLTLHGNRRFDPAYFAAVRQDVRDYGLAERVELLGAVEHHAINDKMRRADLLLQFSKRESYSMVTAEAIACGLPVVSYRTGDHSAFSRSGLVRYFSGNGAAATAVLSGLIADPVAYGALRRIPDWQTRSWRDVGAEFMACMEGNEWPRMSHG